MNADLVWWAYQVLDREIADLKAKGLHSSEIPDELWKSRNDAMAAVDKSERPVVEEWPDKELRGSKRTNLEFCGGSLGDWFVGHGKSEGCLFEGTWWDMICFARNVLASENTRLVAPDYHHPEWRNDNYTGPRPYQFKPRTEGNNV